MSAALRLRLALHRYRAKAKGLIATFHFLFYAYSGRVKEVWIGDSNAVHMNLYDMITAARRMPDGRWVMHLGPRVMFSIAREGLPPAVSRLLRWSSHTPRAKDIVWGFSFGEIDVRCHLVPRMSDPEAALAFIPGYLEVIRQAGTSAGAGRTLVLVPPPQSATYPEQAGFPVNGSIEERTATNLLVRRAMFAAAAKLPSDGTNLLLVDVIDQLSDARGHMREEMTFDGLHTNANGRAVFRQAVDDLLAATAAT
jgi:hypothetical protein